MGGWIEDQPDDFTPSAWGAEASAYDENTGTSAAIFNDNATWLELICSEAVDDVDWLRFFGKIQVTYPSAYENGSWEIEVDWGTGYMNVWSGVIPKNAWKYINLSSIAPAGRKRVERIRTKSNSTDGSRIAHVQEVGVGRTPKEYEVVGDPDGTTPGNGATGISKRSEMWTPPFAYADTQYLYWNDSSPPTTLRKSVKTAESVEWYSEGDWWSDTTYHWRVDATNDVTDDVSGVDPTEGTELSFTTDPACHKIYRGQDGEIDYGQLQAEMVLDDSQVSIPAQNLPPNTIWHYIRREVNHCGLESDDSPVCIVVIDAAGEMVGATPNAPQSVTIEPLAGAKFRLRWRYTPVYEEVPPTGFKVYMAAGGEEFDFGSPTATVPSVLGGFGEFTWTSDELTNDVTYRFCIRSYRSDGGESQNTDYVAAAADSQGPNAITGLRASWEET